MKTDEAKYQFILTWTISISLWSISSQWKSSGLLSLSRIILSAIQEDFFPSHCEELTLVWLDNFLARQSHNQLITDSDW